jgi:hypothetical protein
MRGVLESVLQETALSPDALRNIFHTLTSDKSVKNPRKTLAWALADKDRLAAMLKQPDEERSDFGGPPPNTGQWCDAYQVLGLRGEALEDYRDGRYIAGEMEWRKKTVEQIAKVLKWRVSTCQRLLAFYKESEQKIEHLLRSGDQRSPFPAPDGVRFPWKADDKNNGSDAEVPMP